MSDGRTDEAILTEDEVHRITMAMVGGAGPQGLTEANLARGIEWAENVRLDNALLLGVLKGELLLSFEGSPPEAHFSKPRKG